MFGRMKEFLNRVSRRFSLPIAPALPRKVQIVPTNACNLKCKACPKTFYKTDNRHLSLEVYERARKELFPHAREVELQGLGEPMLSPLFAQMIDDARQMGLKVKFVTNGMMFTQRSVADIVAAGADVTISIDGAYAATHEDSRVGSDFGQLLRILGWFKLASERIKNPQFHLFFSTVVTKRNVAEITGIIKIAKKYDVTVCNLISPGMGDRGDDFAMDAIGRHDALYLKYLPGIIKKSKETGVGVSIPGYILRMADKDAGGASPNSVRNLSPSRSAGRLFPRKCFDPWGTIYVDVDGWIRPCCRAIWIGMGNILNESAREIWNGRHYRRLRRFVNSNNPPVFCRTCTLNWGITAGDENYPKRLTDTGIVLPKPPSIGETYKTE